MTKNQKSLLRIIIVAILYAVAIALKYTLPLHPHLELAIFVAVYLAIGWDIVWKAITHTLKGNLFDENFLMTVATVGAFFIGEQVDAVAVMLLYQIGELFQRYAVGKSRKSIASLMDIRPEVAMVLRDGKEREVHTEDIAIGEIFLVKAGDKIPLDGIVIDGICNIDTSAITGESAPKRVEPTMEVISGCIVLDGVLQIQSASDYDNSTVSQILQLVEEASSQKAQSEKFITKFSKYYTPIVVILAVVLAIVPPLFLGEWAVWLKRAMMFLFVSCPCALVISVPMGFFGGIACASKGGILVKGGNYLEILAKADTFAFDKTGTLTQGNFAVVEVYPKQKATKILQLASNVEQYSNHHIAQAICQKVAPNDEAKVTEIAGKGIVGATIHGVVSCGNAKLMADIGIKVEQSQGTVVHVALDKEYLGYISIADEVKPDAQKCVESLQNLGCKTVMLTGDNGAVAKTVATQLGIDQYHHDLLPADKVNHIQKLKQNGVVAFVGDGINDAPVLASANVGIAMGKNGTDIAKETADVVLMQDNPSAIVTAKRIAKRTIAIVNQNIVFSLIVKFAVLIISAIGVLDNVAFGLIIAILADVGVCVLAILNSMRAMALKKPKQRK